MPKSIKDMWERWNFAFGLLLLAVLLVAVSLKPGEESKRQTVVVPERETLRHRALRSPQPRSR